MARRKPIPQSVRQEVLTEAGYRCAVPTCRTILAIELHHMEEVAKGGSNDASNLLALCPTCHSLYHHKVIPQEAIRVWKSVLVSLNQGFDRDTKDKLLFLALDERPHLFSADGVLHFTNLIASGLAKCGSERYEVHARGAGADLSKSRWPVDLTERGRLLVEAWRKGDPQALENALQTGAGLKRLSSNAEA
jgi:hypothetical protein